MPQDYSTEWRAALIERDMAVRAMVEFLEELDRKKSTMAVVRITRSSNSAPDEFEEYLPGEEPSSLEMLRRVAQQLEKKLKR